MHRCQPHEFRVSLMPCPQGSDHGFVVISCSHETIHLPVETRYQAMLFYRRFLARGVLQQPAFEQAVAEASFLSGDLPEAELPARSPAAWLARLSGDSLGAILDLLRRWRGGPKSRELDN